MTRARPIPRTSAIADAGFRSASFFGRDPVDLVFGYRRRARNIWCCCPDSNGGPTAYESGCFCRFSEGKPRNLSQLSLP